MLSRGKKLTFAPNKDLLGIMKLNNSTENIEMWILESCILQAETLLEFFGLLVIVKETTLKSA